MRERAFSLVALMVLVVMLGAGHASALTIGGGWTTQESAGISYPGAVTGSGTFEEPWSFTLSLTTGILNVSEVIFTNDGTSSDSYFDIRFEATNLSSEGWNAVRIKVIDRTGDPIPVEPDTTEDPMRAHIHRKSWIAEGATHFACADAYCGPNGRYDFWMMLKHGVQPLNNNQTSTGYWLGLHDQDEAGTSPMKFSVEFRQFPEPSAALLLGTGLLAAFWRLRRGAARR